MSKDSDDARENVKQGLGLLWKAARQAARGVKKDVTKAAVTRTVEDAGREIARAATNVAEKVEAELKKVLPKEPEYADKDDPRMKPPYEDAPPEGPDQKPKGPTRSDPGFRIAVDDDDTPDRKR